MVNPAILPKIVETRKIARSQSVSSAVSRCALSATASGSTDGRTKKAQSNASNFKTKNTLDEHEVGTTIQQVRLEALRYEALLDDLVGNEKELQTKNIDCVDGLTGQP